MEITIPFGDENKVIQTELPSENVLVAQSKNPSTGKNWTEVVSEAIHEPMGAEAINKQAEVDGRTITLTAGVRDVSVVALVL